MAIKSPYIPMRFIVISSSALTCYFADLQDIQYQCDNPPNGSTSTYSTTLLDVNIAQSLKLRDMHHLHRQDLEKVTFAHLRGKCLVQIIVCTDVLSDHL